MISCRVHKHHWTWAACPPAGEVGMCSAFTFLFEVAEFYVVIAFRYGCPFAYHFFRVSDICPLLVSHYNLLQSGKQLSFLFSLIKGRKKIPLLTLTILSYS